jgi:hypothetical protein
MALLELKAGVADWTRNLIMEVCNARIAAIGIKTE